MKAVHGERRIVLGPRRFAYAAHSWHQYVHVVQGDAQPSEEREATERGLAASMAQDVCDDSLWLQRDYGFGFRSAAPAAPRAQERVHAPCGVAGCAACAVALDILHAPLAA